ncbi:glycosyltransferase family 2 protein [Pedobacter endophyticus]|uniref:Glycosyltransferase n=1 Tax=Pedobacter endophyticus TaxID=2789740 RepID=A0A7S9L347_9SPHI|nr:glycosyltransferase [Pedobacter endophyticus]QPH41276.1 glycosyltransferase [Pedobacter endophyticus]
MTQKRISVVIPTYNRQTLLLNCLQSLEKQSLPGPDFEVLVVHDGPFNESDLTELKNLNFKFRLSLIQSSIKKGPAAARNLGWLQARYQLIAFTDDDCLPEENWLREILDAYRFETLIAYTGKTIVPLPERPSDFELNTAGLATAEFITANCALTKQALIKVGGFDERFALAWREDSDLEFKLIISNIPIRRNSAAVVVHPVRTVPWGVSLKEQKKGLYDVLLFKKYPELYRQKIQPRPLWNYYLFISLFLLTVIAVGMQNKGIARWTAVLMLIPLGWFFYKRIRITRKSATHIAEMLLTSMLIPFVSVYWRGYGIIKFKKLLF